MKAHGIDGFFSEGGPGESHGQDKIMETFYNRRKWKDNLNPENVWELRGNTCRRNRTRQ